MSFLWSKCPVFSVTWYYRNLFNMMIWCSRNISDLYQCWKQLHIFCVNGYRLLFPLNSLVNRTFKKKSIYFIAIKQVSWASDHHIRVISEGSCDTEDWSNDAKKYNCDHRNKLHFKIYSDRKHLFQTVEIFHYFSAFF